MSDFNPADVAAAVGRVAPDTFSADEDPDAFLEESSVSGDSATAGAETRAREGLPATYRMRADEHYVDQLVQRDDAIHRPVELQLDRDGDEAPATDADDRILAMLASEIAAVEQSAGLLADNASALSRRVAADLIRAQAKRASWLLCVRALMTEEGEHDPRPESVGTILTRVRDGLQAECRLAGVRLQVQASDWQATVTVDAECLVAGLTGAALATMALLSGSEGTVVRVTAVTLNGVLTAVEVRQDAVAVDRLVRRRFFDSDWTDRPGGTLSAIAADASAACARRHNGEAAFMARDRRGSTVRLSLGSGR